VFIVWRKGKPHFVVDLRKLIRNSFQTLIPWLVGGKFYLPSEDQLSSAPWIFRKDFINGESRRKTGGRRHSSHDSHLIEGKSV
jgi:hypothetical protein